MTKTKRNTRDGPRMGVEAGQVYRAGGTGHKSYVRVVRVSGATGPQPKATLIEVTRTGGPKGTKVVRAGKKVDDTFPSWLTIDDGTWRLMSYYELCPELS
jgi:hypothetical protein